MNRKIMIEVTPQEYEKIQAGKLNIEDLTVEELVHQLVKKLGKPYNSYTLQPDVIRMTKEEATVYVYQINKYERFELKIVEERNNARE